MNTSYWNLFWTTGMPEAWLMSRDGAGPVPPPDSVPPREGQLPSGPLVWAQPLSDDRPDGSVGIY